MDERSRALSHGFFIAIVPRDPRLCELVKPDVSSSAGSKKFLGSTMRSPGAGGTIATSMDRITTYVGVAAAICTTTSYVPQVWRTWRTHETHDLSLRMLLLLAAGIALWCAYGILRQDAVIVAANATSLAMLATLIYWKLRLG
jgi:MtN3 and saliva related transmembrane protein